MPLALIIPNPARKAASRALQLQKESPLPDVVGQTVAAELDTGTITFETMQKMHRYFSINKRVVNEQMDLMHTEVDSATIRSFLMHGAESGAAFAATEYGRAVTEGFCTEDPLIDLFSMNPEEVYSRFSLGAWRFEYGLTPTKAARFLEEYTRATGANLEFGRAFGDSAGAVGSALFRRYYEPSPFAVLAQRINSNDTETKMSAHRDLTEINLSKPPRRFVDESVLPTAVKMSVGQAGKILWGPFIAGMILATEDHTAYNEALSGFPKAPAPDATAKKFTQYDDVTGTYVLYFHPQGKHYVAPTEKFEGIGEEIFNIVKRRSSPLQKKTVTETLQRARVWLVHNRLAGSLFHSLIVAWKKKDWRFILDHVPPDSDMFGPFTEIVKRLEKSG